MQACDYFADEQRLGFLCTVLGRRLFCFESHPLSSLNQVWSESHANLEGAQNEVSSPLCKGAAQPAQAWSQTLCSTLAFNFN
jgi:hypothetical protein